MTHQIGGMKQLKIIISGGGSGGHIFPAVAIAKSLLEKNNNIEFLFVGAKDKMEMEKIPNEGFKIVGLWISGFHRGKIFKNLLFPIKLIFSLIKSFFLIKKFDPDLVIGTGGFASGPILYIASKFNVPTLIQEQNSYAGITNKILSKHVNSICVSYEKMDRFFPRNKIIITGNPVRKKIIEITSDHIDKSNLFNLNSENKTILIIGGSLGARTINETIGNGLERFKQHNLNIIWQTGKSFSEKANELIATINTRGITTHTFIKKIEIAYGLADIIVSRAGAIAISELCVVGKPVILIPSPNVAENHQYKNAQSLVNKNAAILVKDSQANNKLVDEIIKLKDNPILMKELSENIKKMEYKNATNVISDYALNLIKK